jgi:2-phospho-L-lactate guanylyltransferase
VRTADWVVVIPVKRLGAAKSRLRGAVDDSRHEELALAMVCDTVAAARACPAVADVLVVTDDPAAAAAVTALGARAVPDAPAAGLNAAARFGADEVAGLGRRRAALAGDLPGLHATELATALETVQATELATALRAAGQTRCFVPDAAGTGTVLLTAPAGVPLDPRFGADSARRHAASGAVEIAGDWPGLRHDVDTAGDLRTVLALGAGAQTAALLHDLCRTGAHPPG